MLLSVCSCLFKRSFIGLHPSEGLQLHYAKPQKYVWCYTRGQSQIWAALVTFQNFTINAASLFRKCSPAGARVHQTARKRGVSSPTWRESQRGGVQLWGPGAPTPLLQVRVAWCQHQYGFTAENGAANDDVRSHQRRSRWYCPWFWGCDFTININKTNSASLCWPQFCPERFNGPLAHVVRCKLMPPQLKRWQMKTNDKMIICC